MHCICVCLCVCIYVCAYLICNILQWYLLFIRLHYFIFPSPSSLSLIHVDSRINNNYVQLILGAQLPQQHPFKLVVLYGPNLVTLLGVASMVRTCLDTNLCCFFVSFQVISPST